MSTALRHEIRGFPSSYSSFLQSLVSKFRFPPENDSFPLISLLVNLMSQVDNGHPWGIGQGQQIRNCLHDDKITIPETKHDSRLSQTKMCLIFAAESLI